MNIYRIIDRDGDYNEFGVTLEGQVSWRFLHSPNQMSQWVKCDVFDDSWTGPGFGPVRAWVREELAKL